MITKTMTRDEAARHLAELHLNVDPSLTAVYRVLAENEDAEGEPIKLLEVNPETYPSDQIWPIGFDATASSGYFPAILMEVTPRQFDELRANRLQLPRQWTLGEEIRVSQP